MLRSVFHAGPVWQLVYKSRAFMNPALAKLLVSAPILFVHMMVFFSIDVEGMDKVCLEMDAGIKFPLCWRWVTVHWWLYKGRGYISSSRIGDKSPFFNSLVPPRPLLSLVPASFGKGKGNGPVAPAPTLGPCLPGRSWTTSCYSSITTIQARGQRTKMTWFFLVALSRTS